MYEGTPIHLMAELAGLAVGVALYSVCTYAIIRGVVGRHHKHDVAG